MPSGFFNNLGPANAGAAAGVQNYATFMQHSANINDLVTADRYRREYLAAPPPIPGTVTPGADQYFAAPAGLVSPNYQPAGTPLPMVGSTWAPWPSQQGGMPGTGTAATGSPTAGLQQKQLYNPANDPSIPAPLGIREAQGWQTSGIPNIVPTGPDKSGLQNIIGTGVNLAGSVPGAIRDFGANLIQRPIVNAGAALFGTPEPIGGPTNGTGQAPTWGDMQAFSGASVPGGVSGTMAPANPSQSAPPMGSPAALRPSGNTPETVGGSSASNAATSEFIRKTHTDQVAMFTMEQQRLMQKRSQLEAQINAQLESIYQQRDRTVARNSQRVEAVSSRLEIARRAGNVAAMEQFYNQIDAINGETQSEIDNADMAADTLRLQGEGLFEENTAGLWNAEVNIAASNFVNAGDPSRLEQIMSSFEGHTVRLQPTKDGKWMINDFMNGQQTRRKAALTSDQVIDQVYMRIDAEFRANSLAKKDAAAQSAVEFTQELIKINAKGAADFQAKMAEKMMDLQETIVTPLAEDAVTGQQQVLITRKDGSDPWIFNPGGAEIPDSGGLTTAPNYRPVQSL